MPYTQAELANIANSSLEYFFDRPNVSKQNIQDKPLLKALDGAAGDFTGGNGNISIRVKSGQGGGSLAGYTNDDQVSYYNPASQRRVNYVWREHHIGIGMTHSELKTDGVTVVESKGGMDTVEKDGAEETRLAGLLEEKLSDLNEDYAYSLNRLLMGDGTADPKALAGIQSILLASPAVGTSGGLSRVVYPWWRNRAATAAYASAGGTGAVTSSTSAGGALLQFLQKEYRQLRRFAQGGVKHLTIAGSDFIDAMEKEARANGNYTLTGFRDKASVDGGMNTDDGVPFKNWNVQYDPTLDDLGLSKRLYVLDLRRIRLLYMKGEKMKKTAPARPFDRYTIYMGLTTTGAMVAQQLNTSGVYDIA